MAQRIKLIDVTLRDGNQSLWSAIGIDTRTVVDVAPWLDRAGFKCIDFTTSTHMAISVRYHREDPYEKIRLARQLMPNTPLIFMTTGMRFITWEPAPRAIIRLAMRVVLRHGIRRIQIVEPMNNMSALLEAARIAREEGAETVVAGLVYSISPVHTDDFYVRCAQELARERHLIDTVYIKDPSGLLTPERVRTIVPALRAALGEDMPLEIHSHCNMGMAPLCYLEAARLGVETVHTAIPPLAEGTSLPSISRTVANLRELGFEVEIDLEPLQHVSEYLFRLARRKGYPIGQPLEYDVSYYRHQVPGGMITTLRRHLKEAGAEHRFQDVLEEIVRVRAELGYPIMVTPYSQLVATQALMNLESRERYEKVPDEVIKYVLGRYGPPPAPIDPWVKERVLSLPRARELDVPIPEPTLEELRREFGGTISDEELLLRWALPGDQVDAALARKTGNVTVNGNGVTHPLAQLIAEVARRPTISFFHLEKDGIRLTLSRQATRRA
ncbi:MAG: biotin carboxyl carrier protein [Thermomicrobium sp.]|nr:biotin carboxyl carrier protein [Thermomicrobium sp.]MDW8006515.1 biotin carboxyl carrier protein [Thermomicrobium sp.]